MSVNEIGHAAAAPVARESANAASVSGAAAKGIPEGTSVDMYAIIDLLSSLAISKKELTRNSRGMATQEKFNKHMDAAKAEMKAATEALGAGLAGAAVGMAGAGAGMHGAIKSARISMGKGSHAPGAQGATAAGGNPTSFLDKAKGHLSRATDHIGSAFDSLKGKLGAGPGAPGASPNGKPDRNDLGDLDSSKRYSAAMAAGDKGRAAADVGRTVSGGIESIGAYCTSSGKAEADVLRAEAETCQSAVDMLTELITECDKLLDKSHDAVKGMQQSGTDTTRSIVK